MEVWKFIMQFCRILVIGLLSINLYPSKLNAADFTLVEENYASFTFANKLSIFDETETFMYSVHKESGYDHEIFQTYQLVDQQYKLLSEYRLGEQYDFSRVDTLELKLVGNKVYALGSEAYVEFSIEDNTLQFVKHVSYESPNRFFENSIKINDSYTMTFDSDNVYFWSFTEQGVALAYEHGHTSGGDNFRDSKWLYHQESETLWKAQSGMGNVLLTSYSIDLNASSISMIQEFTTDITEPTFYDMKLFQHDHASDKFFLKTSSYELFLSISETGLLNVLSSSESNGGQVRGRVNLDSYVDLFYVDDSIEQYYKRIDWSGNLIDSQLVAVNTVPVYDFTLLTWVDTPKFLTLLSANKALMSHPNISNSDAFSIHDVADTINTEPQPLSLGDFDKLPTRVLSKIYDPDTQMLLIAGKHNRSDRFRLYAWKHNAQRNGFDFIASSDLGFGDTLGDNVTVTLVGIKGDNYYLLKSSVNEPVLALIRVQLIDQELVVQESVSTVATHNDELFFADDNTIVLRHNSISTLDLSLCNLDTQNNLTGCEQKTLLDSLNIDNIYLYDFFPIEANGTFLFANGSSLLGGSDTPPNYYILSFDKPANDFEVTQTFQPSSEYAPGSYGGVDNIHVSADGLNLYLFGNKTYHYTYESAGSSWSFSGSVSDASLDTFSVHARGDYFLDRDGSNIWLLDFGENKFYRSFHFDRLEAGNAWYNLLLGEQGFFLGGLGSNHLSTFAIDDSTPAIYKGNLPTTPFDILQDEEVNLNLDAYFLNGHNLTVTGLKDNLFWDGNAIIGHLTNDDMFFYEDISIDTPASEFPVSFYIGSLSENPSASLNIMPINVNDSPILTDSFDTQNFDIDDEVLIILYETVIDPDREALVFTYQNLPPGMEGKSNGSISGRASRSGSYSIDIVATDDEGAFVSFSLSVVVSGSNSLQPATESSGGGGSTGLLLIVFVFFVRLCRNRVCD